MSYFNFGNILRLYKNIEINMNKINANNNKHYPLLCSTVRHSYSYRTSVSSSERKIQYLICDDVMAGKTWILQFHGKSQDLENFFITEN